MHDIQHPWLKNYPEFANWHQKFTAQPLYSILDDSAERFPRNTALDFLGKSITYAELQSQVNRLAKGLQSIGVGKDTKVGIYMPNSMEFVISFFAILKAGGIVVNYSPLYSVPELLHQVEDSDTDVMLTHDLKTLYPAIHHVCEQSRLKKLVVAHFADGLPFIQKTLFKLFKKDTVSPVVDDQYHVEFNALLDNDGKYRAPEIDVDEDVAVLQYTGGTTGLPKGAMLTHANIYNNVQQLEAWADELEYGVEVVPGFLPFFHVFSMTVVMILSIRFGSKVMIMPRFELDAAMKMIKKEKPTIFSGVPTMYTAILNHKDVATIGLENIKNCMSGGAPLPVELGKVYRERFGVMISEGYGLSECSPVVTSNPYDRPGRPGSIGLPIPGTEIIIVDKEDYSKILPQGEAGEICIRGPQVMKGYWKRPDATAETIVNGMLRTGDVGYMDEEGYTYIIDRTKDMILVGGYNVFPRTIEEALYEHPAVHEATVIGVPDDYSGERPKAFVALKDPEEDLSEEKLMNFIMERLGKHERPINIEFRAELPKTMVGKLSKKELKAEEQALYEARKEA